MSTDRGTFRARLLVGADGVHSVFHGSLGLRVRAGSRRMGLSSHWQDARFEPRAVEVTSFPGGEMYVAPVESGSLVVALLVNHEVGVGRQNLEAFLRERYPSRFRAARLAGQILGASPLSLRVNRMTGDGWLLVGDAGGAVDPITGEGLSIALTSAAIAGKIVPRALAGEATLSEYESAVRRFRAPMERLTRLVLFFSHHSRLGAVLLRREETLLPLLRTAVAATP